MQHISPPSHVNIVNKALMSVFRNLASRFLLLAAVLFSGIFISLSALNAQETTPKKQYPGDRHFATVRANSHDADKPKAKDGAAPIKDDPEGRREFFREWFGPTTNEYLDYKTLVGEREIEKWGYKIPGTRTYKPLPLTVNGGVPPKQWLSIGPFDGSSLQNDIRDPNVTDTGRPTVILPHPTNPNVIYVGFAGGGLWRCQNADLATNNDWVWEAMTDGLPVGGNTSIGAAAFKHDNPNTLYLSLGDMMTGSGGGGTAVGRGFYISNDGGETWDRGGELGDSDRTKTVISLPGNVILVAGNKGLYRSTNGGVNFTHMQPLQSNMCWDILKLDNGRVLLTYGDDGVQYGSQRGGIAWSEDNGATWTKANITSGTAAMPTDSYGFGRIAIAASGNTLYGLYQASGSSFPQALLKSEDGGKNWVTNTANSLFQGNYSGDGRQAGYNHMVAVDPENPNVVFVGTNLSVYRSTDGGANFSQFTSWVGMGFQYTHADMHAGVWTPPGRPKALYLATDGGISIIRQPNINPIPTGSSNLFLSDPQIIDHRRNRGLATHLIYNLGSTNAATPPGSRDRVIIGTQDNGTLLRKDVAKNYYDYVIGGDGFGCLVHPYNGNLMLGSVYNTRIFRSTNGGYAFTEITNGLPGGGPFYTRLTQEMADPAGNRVYTFTNTVPYVSNDFGLNWTALNTGSGSGWYSNTIRNIGASPCKEGLVGVVFNNTVAISDDFGQNWRTSSGFTNSPGLLSDVAFDTKDASVMYVASVANARSNNHLWKSMNGGYTWAAIDGSQNNPNGIPFGTPIHVVKVDPLDNQVVYAGTDYGIYYTTNQGATWERFGYGLPLASVWDIYIAPDGSFMRVGTHGRGVWEMQGMTEAYAPQIASQPRDTGAYDGGQATFGVTVIGIPAPSYQWQVSANGASWSDVANTTDRLYTGTFNIADNGKRFRVVVTNSAGSVTSSAATLSVAPAIVINVSPASVTIPIENIQPVVFTATVTGGFGNKNFTWSATGGSITSGGVYTAAKMKGTFTIKATSVENPSMYGTATVTIAAPISVSISPKTANLSVDAAREFTAIVKDGAGNKNVTWAATGGTITQSGVYTAPNAPGTYTVTVRSAEDVTKFDTATVTVVSGVAVNVTPQTVRLTVGGAHTFTADVMGSQGNSGVAWSASAGSIDAQGIFTAPKSPRIVTITATSIENPSRFGTAMVSVLGERDVYLTGFNNGYYKNGVLRQLQFSSGSSSAYGNSIFVSNGNVYVAGYESNAGYPVAKLWVNGVLQDLSISAGSQYSYAYSVFVSNGNVYVAGYENNAGYRVAKLWVNGAGQNLSGGGVLDAATSVFVSNGNVYVAGDVYNAQGHKVAKLWVNGVGQDLSEGSRDAEAGTDSVFVSNGIAYVAGEELNAQNVYIAKLWINGVGQDLSDGSWNAIAFSVFVSNGDVYVAGEDSVAKLWVNGAPQDLSDESNYANSVYVYEDDVYVAGGGYLWINGVRQSGYGYGNSVFVAPAISVEVAPNTATMAVGSSRTFTATVAGDYKNMGVTWSATDGTITQDGLYTAPNTPGTSTVTATSVEDNTKSDTATVIVNSATVPVTGVSLNKNATTLIVGGSEQLTATVLPTNATNKTVTWSSSNNAVASVLNGLVTAVAQGTATITVTTQDGNHQATCVVTVNPANVPVTGVSLNKTATTLIVGGSEQLTATILPTNATNKTVTWSSSNNAVASVLNGLVTAVAQGNATITATTQDGGHQASCVVAVAAGATGRAIILNAPGAMFPGDTVTLQANITGLSNTAVAWAASAGTIDQQGRYTAPSSSSAQIVTIVAASVQEPSISASAQIRINNPAMANFDGNTPKTPQLLGLANAFGSRSQADLDKYDLNNNGIVDDGDSQMLFRFMGW